MTPRYLEAAIACIALTSLLAASGSWPAAAAELLTHEFAYDGTTYEYAFEARLDADAATAWEVITEFGALTAETNPNITGSRVLRREPNGDLQRMLVIEYCVLAYCFDLRFLESVHFPDASTLVATIDPAGSSFRGGTQTWHIEPSSDGTALLSVSARHTPDFWIPPVIGPWLMRGSFLSEIEETTRNIERLARAPGNF